MAIVVLKIGRSHCPEELTNPLEPRAWCGGLFKIPVPKSLFGEPAKIHVGDKAYIWTHENQRKKLMERGNGLSAEATIAAIDCSERHYSVTVDDIQLFDRPLGRATLYQIAGESSVVSSLLNYTVSRTIVLSPQQADEFLIALNDAKIIVQCDEQEETKPDERRMRVEWSDQELEECFRAYFEMLGRELAGQPYNKKAQRLALQRGPLRRRSTSSIEYRMQNISSFLHGKTLPYISGYKPRAHIGDKMFARFEQAFSRTMALCTQGDILQASPNADQEPLIRIDDLYVPLGSTTPAKKTVSNAQFVRSQAVIQYVLRRAAGVCECCDQHAPFQVESGEPFLEVHHVNFLAEGGGDTIDNAVAVCPNCHRALHFSQDRRARKLLLISKVPGLRAD